MVGSHYPHYLLIASAREQQQKAMPAFIWIEIQALTCLKSYYRGLSLQEINLKNSKKIKADFLQRKLHNENTDLWLHMVSIFY